MKDETLVPDHRYPIEIHRGTLTRNNVRRAKSPSYLSLLAWCIVGAMTLAVFVAVASR